MKPSPVAFAALIAVSACLWGEGAQAQSAQFAARFSCESAGRYSREQCDNAFVNALAEFEEGMPRFSKRADCEKRFGRCQIAGLGSGGVSFGPIMDGVVITNRGGNITVVPVAKGARPPVPFSERTILQRKAERSDRKQREAQKRWEAQWAAPEGVPPEGAGPVATPGAPEPFDENWQKQEGVAKYPAPAARAKKPPQS